MLGKVAEALCRVEEPDWKIAEKKQAMRTLVNKWERFGATPLQPDRGLE